jgi:hypothetical protein
MGAILDYITSVVIFGVLLLTVARVQTNLQSTLGQSTFNLTTQRSGVELARQIEYDFLKIGHRVNGLKIGVADSTRITFRSDLENNHNVLTVAYRAGTPSEATYSMNPDDFPLYRAINGVAVRQNFGLTSFRIWYFDSLYNQMTTPITVVDSLRKIKSIRVRFTVTSQDPITDGIDTVWSAITWEKHIIPRNLAKLDL